MNLSMGVSECDEVMDSVWNLKCQKTQRQQQSGMEIYRGGETRSQAKRATEPSPVGTSKTITKKIQNYYFNLNDILGKGSFSTVYRGVEEKTEEVVAVKVIELNKIESPTLKELLYSEIQILKSIRHPNILQCYEVFFSANHCYIITEYCNEGDVKKLLTQSGPLPERAASKIILGVFEGLKYLSKEHIVHRDLKTANVFMKNGKPKIADFGFAKRTKEPFKDINIGSPVCMSPEGIIHNIYGPKTDVWAFGIYLYEVLHGSNIFSYCKTEGELKEAVAKQVKVDQLYQGLSPELHELIISCLEVSIDNRATIEELEFTPYIKKLQQSAKNLNIQVSQVEEFLVNTYDSKVSTDVPIVTDRRGVFPKKNRNFGDFSSHIKGEPNESYNKTDRYIQNKFSSFDAKVNSPKQSHKHSKRQITYEIDLKKDRKHKRNIQSSLKEPETVKPSPYGNQKERNSMNLSDRKFAPLSLKKEPKTLTSTVINYKSAGTFQASGTNPLQTPKERADKLPSSHQSLEFQDLLSLLHYCRVVYKTIKIVMKLPYQVQYLTSWLFFILSKIKSHIPAEPSSQLKKLKEILTDYTIKYKRELYTQSNTQVQFSRMQDVLSEVKLYLQKHSGKDELGLIYARFLYDLNMILNDCMFKGAYREFTEKSRAEEFLNSKPEQHCKRKAVTKF